MGLHFLLGYNTNSFDHCRMNLVVYQMRVNELVGLAKTVQPYNLGELEITSINEMYFESGELVLKLLGIGFERLDTGTNESLLDAAMFVQTIENRQGSKVACLEKIALKNDWLTRSQIKKSAETLPNNSYSTYLVSLV